ncbi:CDP-diacylglycerol--glycerol-3-phosphate 3-phosphatidyltransferase [Rhodospirillaceae bacterium SYSU D60014]|uniref:CDP-diacylglycerol--glycerol-3-phosphate 3-phosphatidyltransferase n=1 Tax=Virgifigura deserti TaxID=2268457 RepID=UPI000E66B788
MLTSLPNLLTLSRIAIIPVLVGLFFVEGDVWRWVSGFLFGAAGITDYFDGRFARSRAQITKIGVFLDPIADKLLVAAVILMLAFSERISGLVILPALVILCREVLVSGLREFLAGLNVSVPVSRLAKWKTMLQMLALGFLIVGDAGPAAVPVTEIGEIGLWLAAILTLVTGYDYLVTGLRHMGPDTPARRPGAASTRSRSSAVRPPKPAR